jgi:hypothetical protein
MYLAGTTNMVAGPDDDVQISFVGHPGPKNASAAAPLGIAPLDALFLNNQFCWVGVRAHAGPQLQSEVQFDRVDQPDVPPAKLNVSFTNFAAALKLKSWRLISTLASCI